jgi:transposase
MAQNGVNVLPWPAVSPDQNPIEHMWDEVGRRVLNNHKINSVNDLRLTPLV